MPDDNFPRTSTTLLELIRGPLRSSGPEGAKGPPGPLTPEGRAALEMLCKAYRYPVYAFLRHRVGSADKAADLTQGFFAYLIAKEDLATFDRTRGTKFRSW